MTIAYDTTLARTDRVTPPRWRVATLSAAKRHALTACFNAGGLSRRNGAWHGGPDDKPICGVTVADLARDGLLTLSTENRLGAAHLTERGSSCARALIDEAGSAALDLSHLGERSREAAAAAPATEP